MTKHISQKPTQKDSKQIQSWLEEIQQMDLSWKEKADTIYERKLSLTDPTIIRINHLRQAFRFYLIPLFEQLLTQSSEEQAQFSKYMSPFVSKKRSNQFFKHFYSVQGEGANQSGFIERDEFENDVFVLYDLYKAKKTIQAAEMLIQEIETSENYFKSIFSKDQQLQIAKGFRLALLMTFKQSLKAEYQKMLFQEINPQFITQEQIEIRRKDNTIYANPDTIQGSPYRRIFLHILLRQHIKTRINNKEVNIQYNVIHFELLKHEYLTYWAKRLGNHPEKLKIYQTLHFQEKTFAEWIMENPDSENQFLENLPSEDFNQVMDQIQSTVEPEKQSTVEPLSDHSPVLKEINTGFQSFLNKFHPQLSVTKSSKTVLKQLDKASRINNTLTELNQRAEASNNPSLSIAPPAYRGEIQFQGTAPKIVVLAPPSFIDSFYPELHKRIKDHNLAIEVMDVNQTNIQELRKCSLIMTLHCQFPSYDKNNRLIEKEELRAELIDSTIPLSQYPLPLLNDGQEDPLARRFLELKLDIQTNETNPHHIKIYQQDTERWLLEEEQQKQKKLASKLRNHSSMLLTQYQMLLFWLILEALEQAGHNQQLIHALLRVSRCLIIDGMEQHTLQYLSSVGFNRQMLATWDQHKLEKELKKYQKQLDGIPLGGIPSKHESIPIELFFRQRLFDNYDVVLMTDWSQSDEKMLPVYLRIRQYTKEKASSSSVKTFQINLLEIFNEKTSYLEQCFNRLQEIQGTATKFQRNTSSLVRLIQTQKKIIEIVQHQDRFLERIQSLNSEIQIFPKKILPFDLDKHLHSHYMNRIEFFILGHKLRFLSQST